MVPWTSVFETTTTTAAVTGKSIGPRELINIPVINVESQCTVVKQSMLLPRLLSV